MYRILIADDEPIERKVVCKTIRKYFGGQLDVVEAANGREAAQFFFEKKCQIALLDIEMPGMNGLDAAEQIRARDKTCSILFLTAYDEFSYAKRAISIRALDYLLKPGPDEELVAALEEALRLLKEREEGAGREGGRREEELLKREAVRKETVKDGDDNAENIRLNAVAEHIRTYIREHYREDISLQDVAGTLHYSDAYFCRIFKQCFHKSFIVYLSEFRVEKAKRLLADAVVSIKDVGVRVGYRDANYFAKVFKRTAGITPSDYRMKVLQDRGQPEDTE